jgi:hypothetical protein
MFESENSADPDVGVNRARDRSSIERKESKHRRKGNMVQNAKEG